MLKRTLFLFVSVGVLMLVPHANRIALSDESGTAAPGDCADRCEVNPAGRQAGSEKDVAVGRPARDKMDLDYWRRNMSAHHFTVEEMAMALGVSTSEAGSLLEKKDDSDSKLSAKIPPTGSGNVVVLPYPGGRHPRVGFLDGAVNPQRETKVSLFAPWKGGGYLVIDVPEAVWHQPGGKRELLYLAHTHVPTIWDKQGVTLPQREWNRDQPGTLSLTREFPNKVAMTSRVQIVDGGLRMEFRLTNGSDAELTGLHIQMCAMLKGLTGFADQTNENKVFESPFAACKSREGDRWVILAFDHCLRAWGNPPCPCLHADPQVPDCGPGESHAVHGWASFYEGTDIRSEFKRLEKIAFEPVPNP